MFIENALKKVGLDLEIKPLGKAGGHGPKGGDVIIADEICEVFDKIPLDERHLLKGPLYHVVFFIDHKLSQPHEPDIQVLLRTCVNPELRANVVLNTYMAEEWIIRYERREAGSVIPPGTHTRRRSEPAGLRIA